MNIVKNVRSFLKTVYSSIVENCIATMKLLGIPSSLSSCNAVADEIISESTDNCTKSQVYHPCNYTRNNGVRIVKIDNRYRSKNITPSGARYQDKLTSGRIYKKGMKVSAYIYNKITHEIGERLTTSSSIRDAADLYMIHPSMVSACAVYNKLYDVFGKYYADNHVRKVKKYITPGAIDNLSDTEQKAILTNTNTITFKYE